MVIRNCGFGLLAAMLVLGGGCKKSSSPEAGADPLKGAKTGSDSAVRVHWLGMKRLLAETNAAGFKKIWDLPETARLEAQTLNKLALAPWRHSIPVLQGAATNYPSLITNYPSLVRNHEFASKLRPLLEDVVQQECYFELRPRTNSPADMVLAVRLDQQRSAAWQTNLLAIAENLTGTNAPGESTTNGWSLPLTRHPSTLSFSRAGAWTLIGLSGEKGALVSDLTRRIETQPSGDPFESRTTNFWLEANLDLQRLWPAFAQSIGLPAELPETSLTCIGNGQDVLTRGTFTFSKPLPFTIEPWNIPTNLLHEPLDSSTGLQGIRPWLSSLKLWKDLNVGEPPDQAFGWARHGIPFDTYFAVSVTNANAMLDKIRDYMLQEGNAWLRTNATGYFENATNKNALLWKVVPFMAPIIQPVALPNGSFLIAGLAPNTSTNPPPTAATLHEVTSRTNVFYYDWELTGPRLEEWLYISQLFRVMFHKAQIPSKSLSIAWIKKLEPMLHESSTAFARTGRDRISFARSSGVGLTAVEIHALMDWLESPDFPYGLHTFVAQRVNMRHIGPRTPQSKSPRRVR